VFHGLGPLVSSEWELTSETMDSFKYFDGTPWTGDQPIARPLPTQDETKREEAGIYPYLERDANSRSYYQYPYAATGTGVKKILI